MIWHDRRPLRLNERQSFHELHLSFLHQKSYQARGRPRLPRHTMHQNRLFFVHSLLNKVNTIWEKIYYFLLTHVSNNKSLVIKFIRIKIFYLASDVENSLDAKGVQAIFISGCTLSSQINIVNDVV